MSPLRVDKTALATWADCLSQDRNCEYSVSQTSPMAHTDPAFLTLRYSSTTTYPLALRNFSGTYEEFGTKPNVGMVKSAASRSPFERMSSCPLGVWVELVSFACSLISTFNFRSEFVAIFDTAAGLPSRTVGPPPSCEC